MFWCCFYPQLVNKLHLFHCEDDGVDKSVFFLFCFFVYYLQLLCWDLYLVFCWLNYSATPLPILYNFSTTFPPFYHSFFYSSFVSLSAVTLVWLYVRGHLHSGASLSSAAAASAARRVRQLPQLPPQSSSVDQGTRKDALQYLLVWPKKTIGVVCSVLVFCPVKSFILVSSDPSTYFHMFAAPLTWPVINF